MIIFISYTSSNIHGLYTHKVWRNLKDTFDYCPIPAHQTRPNALAWTPEGHCRCLVKNKTPHQNSNFMPPTSPENELLDPKIEKSPTSMDSHATMTFPNDSIFSSKSANRSGLICILNFWKFTNRNQRRKKLFFFISQNCIFVFVFFFSLEKFNPYWLTQSQMLFFFSGTGKKNQHFYSLTRFFRKNVQKQTLAGK